METTPVSPAVRTVKVRVTKTAVSKSSSKAVAAIVTKQPAAKPKRKVLSKKSTSPAAGDRSMTELVGVEQSAVELDAEIAMAAYYLAEQRHFVPGYELDDWLAAEQQLRIALSK